MAENYEIQIKKNDTQHVEHQIQERYFDFQSDLGLNLYLTQDQIRNEVIVILSSADIRQTKKDQDQNRCHFQKYVIEGYSRILLTNIVGVVFQDEEKKIRYLLTVFKSNPQDFLGNQ